MLGALREVLLSKHFFYRNIEVVNQKRYTGIYCNNVKFYRLKNHFSPVRRTKIKKLKVEGPKWNESQSTGTKIVFLTYFIF